MHPIDSMVILDLLTIEERTSILAQLVAADSAPVHVYGAADGARIDARVRRTNRITPPPAVAALMHDRLSLVRPGLSEYFGVELTHHEEPQFLRYAPGDFFVAHQDGNTPMLRDDSMHRRVSVVIFLNPGSEARADGSYGGGTLVFHGRYPDYDARTLVTQTPGSLIAFRSETTHEVTPVTHGLRFTVATWYR